MSQDRLNFAQMSVLNRKSFRYKKSCPKAKQNVRFQYSSLLSEGQPYLLFLTLKRQFMKFSWNVGLQR